MLIGSAMCRVKRNDTIMLYDRQNNKKHILNLRLAKGKFSTDKGTIDLDSLVGIQYGSVVKSHLGHEYLLLQVTLYDFIMKKLNRLTQIVYPKDAAYILLKLDVKPGDTVLESGIGSGAMTAVFARYVGESGMVVSYEKRDEFIKNALSNLRKIGLDERVTIKQRDIIEGFDERNVDALFLDVREPWLYLDKAYEALKRGGMIGVVVPTTNQVSETLLAFERLSFIDTEVGELLYRRYKPVADRLRPEDRMSAHTAYMIFARKV